MEHRRIIEALLFIEDNLKEKIKLEDVAKIACFSLYHFHRVFQSLFDVTLKGYIRRRRLSEASKEILNTKRKIIEIAFDYQYDTPESFSKAFKKIYGIAPRSIRKNFKEHRFFEPIDIKNFISNNRGEYMEPEIITRSAFTIMGIELKTSRKDGIAFKEIPDFWKKANKEDVYNRVPNKSEPEVCYGACADCNEDESFRYIIGNEVSNTTEIPEGMVVLKIPETKYARFTAKGKFPDSIQNTIKYIFGTWVPSTSNELGSTPDFEQYDARKINDTNEDECQIYIPLKID